MAVAPPNDQSYHQKEEEEEEEEEEKIRTKHQQHLCDFCNDSVPVLYCRADSAKLCFSCDRRVHLDNPLFSKHHRSHLCDSCSSNPASILCSTHLLFLCPNCDWDAHHSLPSSTAHDRRPLVPFSACPSAFDFASSYGLDYKHILSEGSEDGDDKDAGDWADGLLDEWVWETPDPILSLDDLIVPTTPVAGSCRSLQALAFSPPSKHRNVSCGKHKEEIIRQLRKLVKTEANFYNDHGKFDSALELQYSDPEKNFQPPSMGTEFEHDPIVVPVPEMQASTIEWHGNNCEGTDQVLFSYTHLLESTIEESSLVPEGDTDIHVSRSHTNDDKKQQSSFLGENPLLPPKGVYELAGPEREMVISRYKEKKKARRYDKHIRYESRKSRAESRTRIKGRFAKVNGDQNVESVRRQV